MYEWPVIKIKAELARKLPAVQGDVTLLRQVLHNLLQNAQDALDGQPEPIIGISSEVANGKIKLTISDNGCGFSLDMMAHVFEPYVTTKHHGTGLGLTIVKKIVEEHKGSIKIENRKQGGARVTVLLPMAIKTMEHKE